MKRTLCLAGFLCLASLACVMSKKGASSGTARWLKGNTHTHTLWSDGDAAPEVAAAWYKEHGYDFLVLSDHNILSVGERWMPVTEDGRLTPAQLDGLRSRARLDAAEVETRDNGGVLEMRLQTLAELRGRFERPGEFLFIQGEEITDAFETAEGTSLPVHVNAVNLTELVTPRGGASARDVMNHNVDAAIAQGERLGRPVLAHVNHPNFGWGLTWEDVATVAGDRFFEVYNGHRGVRNHGDGEHVSTEEMWDRALTLRLTELDLGLLYGVATDDAHSYYGGRVSVPGRGWVMVRAETLAADAVVRAMKRGAFYASSGVSVRHFESDGERYLVDVDREPGVSYTTRFLGTRTRGGRPLAIGEELARSTANPAEYVFRGDELYVRAVVSSSRLHPDPYAEGDLETAWLQPVVP